MQIDGNFDCSLRFGCLASMMRVFFKVWDWDLADKIRDLMPKDLGFGTRDMIWDLPVTE